LSITISAFAAEKKEKTKTAERLMCALLANNFPLPRCHGPAEAFKRVALHYIGFQNRPKRLQSVPDLRLLKIVKIDCLVTNLG
jgi:hypothetical protein